MDGVLASSYGRGEDGPGWWRRLGTAERSDELLFAVFPTSMMCCSCLACMFEEEDCLGHIYRGRARQFKTKTSLHTPRMAPSLNSLETKISMEYLRGCSRGKTKNARSSELQFRSFSCSLWKAMFWLHWLCMETPCKRVHVRWLTDMEGHNRCPHFLPLF